MASQLRKNEEYEVLDFIGRGSFGEVRKVKRLRDGLILVRKEVQYGHMNKKQRIQIVSELRILNELNHPNIVRYIEHDHDQEKHMLYLYMEYCDGGDLSSIIKKFKATNEFFPEGIVWNIFTQILMALYRCHYGVNSPLIANIYDPLDYPETADSTKVIIHRDIKPDNIFLGSGNFKLGDFGLAKLLNQDFEFATTCVGTPYYMSPEILLDAPYSPLCDIWSLGCVIYELCTYHPPFQAKTHLQLQEKIKLGRYPPIPEHYSPSLRNIIDRCIQVDQNKRASTSELLQDLNFKIQMKDLQLTNYEINLKKFEKELLIKEQELIDLRQQDIEELNNQRSIIDKELDQICMNYKNEFEYVVEREVSRRMKQLSPSKTNKSSANLQHQQYPSSSGKDSPYTRDNDHYKPPKLPASRRPLQLANDVPPTSKRLTKQIHNTGFAVPKPSNMTFQKNIKLLEKTRIGYDDMAAPSPFLRKFNNNYD